jgi:hypothetical protein
MVPSREYVNMLDRIAITTKNHYVWQIQWLSNVRRMIVTYRETVQLAWRFVCRHLVNFFIASLLLSEANGGILLITKVYILVS